MKRVLLIPFFLLFIFSCKTERGTVEIESLSKKVFDALKDNDFGGIKEIIPSKGSLEKIFIMQGKANQINIDSAYEMFLSTSEQDFIRIRAQIQNWQDATYLNTNEQVEKEENVSFTNVTTKFKVNADPRKLTFTGAKVNGRWYYYGDLHWMEPDSTSEAL